VQKVNLVVGGCIKQPDQLLDVAVENFSTADCRILHYGLPHEAIDISPDSPTYKDYKQHARILRWYFGLMGDTSPRLSPLSVDVAGDKAYRVYRYDWVFGVSLPPPGEFWWDWQKALRKGTSIAVQLIILPGDSGLGYTCVATNLNVLPPSRNTETWWQRYRSGIIEAVKTGAQTAEELYPGKITKAFSALSNSLAAQGKWRTTNWFIYQFLDSTTQGCAVEWLINKKVMQQYGPLLRGSLVLAFHGKPENKEKASRGIRLVLRPQLGFSRRDELSRVTPTSGLKPDEQVKLDVLPQDNTPVSTD